MVADELILLVGGLGTRLRDVVPDLPKPLAPVAGRPFIARLLDRYALVGIRRVVLAAGYRFEQIQATVGTHWAGMDIRYSIEDSPLGTGGAINLAVRQCSGDAVHVANGDTWLEYVPAALERATRALNADAGIALAHVADAGRYGRVATEDGRVTSFEEKGVKDPGWINAGCYFLGPRAIVALAAHGACSFERDFLEPWSQSGRLAAFTGTSRFIDIGIPEDYASAQSALEDVDG